MTPETAPTPKFAIGDVVQLKSGGPLMTVSDPTKPVTCTWFETTGSSLVDDFPQDCLRLIDVETTKTQ